MIPRNLLPGHFMNAAFIAGGYAVCPPLATDMDVWVTYSALARNAAVAKEDIIAHLHDNGWTFEVLPDTCDTLKTKDAAGYPTTILVHKVALVKPDDFNTNIPVHILLTEADVHAVLASFDLTSCQAALTNRGRVIGPNYTPPSQLPRVLKMTPTTPQRREKYIERFDLREPNAVCSQDIDAYALRTGC